MSLINDALKQVQARNTPPENAPNTLPPLQPVAEKSSETPAWFLPAIIVVLVTAAFFFIGWAVMHHGARPGAEQPNLAATIQPVVTPPPAPAPQPVAAVVAPAQLPPVPAPQPVVAQPAPAVQPFVLKLQGIDYSPSAPSAILNGKTVRPGDTFREYRVKAIGRNFVTLVDPENKITQIEMGN